MNSVHHISKKSVGKEGYGFKFLDLCVHIFCEHKDSRKRKKISESINKVFSLFDACEHVPQLSHKICSRKKEKDIDSKTKCIFIRRELPSGVARVLSESVKFFVRELAERKEFAVMHGACVSTPQNSITLIFLGEKGRGKSTATKTLIEMGYRFITEDTLIINLRKKKIVPMPKPIFLKDEKGKFKDIFIPPSYEKNPSKRKVVVLILSKKIKDKKELKKFKVKIKKIGVSFDNISLSGAKRELIRKGLITQIEKEKGILFALKQTYMLNKADKKALLDFLSRCEYFMLDVV